MRIVYLILLPLVFFTPLIQSSAGSLSFTTFDFAEWASLLPAERHASPALLLPFALRLQIVIVFLPAIYFLTMRKTRFNQIIIAAIVGIVVLSQLPPLEFLTQPNDPNYQQQLLITSLFLTASVTIATVLKYHYAKYLLIGLHGIGAGIFLFALPQAHTYLTQYQIPYSLGVAAPLLLFIHATAILSLWQTKRAPQRPSNDPAQA